MGEEKQNKEDLSYTSHRFFLASTLPGSDGGGRCGLVSEEKQNKEDLSSNSLWSQPYLDIDGGGGCCPVGEEEQNKKDLSYTSFGFSLASTLPGYRRRWRL